MMPMHETSWRRHVALLALGVTLAVGTAARDAGAQAAKHEAAAEALFQEGRALYEAGRYAEACPKLAESQRLDPATGTLLALALCHEGEQKLASAWAEFTTVEGEARRAGRTDRENIAREHAAAIRRRLSTLSIDVPAEIRSLPGLELKLDGTPIGPGTFGTAFPVDGGKHELSVAATGKKPWKTSVSVKNENDAVGVTIPPLEDVPEPAQPSARASEPRSTERATSGSPMRAVGLIVAGAGVLTLGAGSYLALTAKADYDAAENRCPETGCSPSDWDAGERAREKGDAATIVFGVGGALVVTGGVLWLTAPKASRQRQAGPRVERVAIGPRGVVVAGAF
jgi:hypothetical protein